MSATPTTFLSGGPVHATNALQGFVFEGGCNTINFTNPEPSSASHDNKTGNVHYKVPRSTNTLFTGRRELLERVKNAMQNASLEPKIYVITGLGGLGKSEICLKIAKEMRHQFWAVFWVDVSNPDIAKSDFVAIARMLGQQVNSIKEACTLLDNVRERCLLILDNADDLNFDYNAYLPSNMQGAVIVTSRCNDCKVFNTVGWEKLTSLDLAHCKELLLKSAWIPKEHWAANARAAANVVSLLQSHTLALIQAGAYIARDHCELSDYPAIFQKQRKTLLEYQPKQAQSRYHDVYATFEASAEVLSQDAIQLLGVLSMLNHTFLPESVFHSAWAGSQGMTVTRTGVESGIGNLSTWDVSQLPCVTDMTNKETGIDVLTSWHVSKLPVFLCSGDPQWNPYHLKEAVCLLESLSLITKTKQDGMSGISMHPLAHAWAKDRQTPEARKDSWLAAGSVVTLSARRSTTRERVEHHLQPHIQAYVDNKIHGNIRCDAQRNIIALVWSCSWMLVQMRDDFRVEGLLKALFREAGLDAAQPQGALVPLYHLRAQSFYLTGNRKMAVDLMEQVAKMRQETLDERDANRLAAGHLLSIACRENGQTNRAVELLEHVVAVRKKVLAEEHPDRLVSQHELAIAYRADGQVKKAVELLEHVAAVKEKVLAEEHPDRLASQHTLAGAYRADGQVKKAVELLEHVVAVEEKVLAEEHPDRLASQHTLAGAYLADGQVKKAVELLEHVVAVQEKVLREDHPSRLVSQDVLADLYAQLSVRLDSS